MVRLSLFKPASSLIAGPSFPVPGPREISPKVPRDHAFSAPRRAAIPSKPRKFPVFSLQIRELSPRDGFALDFSHRQQVCDCRDVAPASRDHPRNSRAFAGSWETGTAESEPETAGSGRRSCCGPRCSLLRSSAVQFRPRCASANAVKR